MIKITLLFTAILLSANLFSQTITDFFENLPDSSILNLSKEQRRIITKYSADNKSYEDAMDDIYEKKMAHAFSVVDLKNGYLKLVGNYDSHLQMCYWNFKNGNKLIAVYQESCGPVCYVERFDFFLYNKKNYTPVSYNSVIPDIEPSFFKGNYTANKKKMSKDDVIAEMLFDLPRNGKNIVAKWGNEDLPEIYKKYGFIGDRMNLVWNDGKFTIGQVYWNE